MRDVFEWSLKHEDCLIDNIKLQPVRGRGGQEEEQKHQEETKDFRIFPADKLKKSSARKGQSKICIRFNYSLSQ
jgi:hypothetical protein